LTFGESLGQLANAEYSSWVGATFAFAKVISVARTGREWGLTKLLSFLVSADVKAKRQSHIQFATAKVEMRMAQKTERPDIWTYVTKNSQIEGQALAPSELHSNGALFMLAGTETTATLLSGLTYILLKNPEKMDRLTKEIKAAFTSLEDMTMVKLSQLEYLQACIEEGLRLYPPVPVGLPRHTPKGGAMVCNRWIPGGVSESSTQLLIRDVVR
jgi:cytochrome P450